MRTEEVASRYGGRYPPVRPVGVSPDAKRYLGLLVKAKAQPEKHSIPICHLHIAGMAESISRREESDMVLVVVESGSKPPDLFGCFLCYLSDAKLDPHGVD